jgi:serine/threonine-protein kinase
MGALAKKKRDPEAPARAAETPAAYNPARAAALVAIGALSALWSLFLWMELVLLRTGGQSFCATGGKLDCSAIWNGAFASAVHRLTGLPIAGWGLVWSAAAFVLPLLELVRGARGRDVRSIASAVRWTAAAGLAAVAGMIVASVAAGAICIGCIGTYVLVAAYGVVALRRGRPAGAPDWGRGAVLAGGCAAAAFVLLLYPGLRTPKSSGERGRQAVEAASRPAAAESGTNEATRGTDPRRDRELTALVASLEPALKQTLADSLAIYRAALPQPLPPPRALVGSDLAPVRITEFTDILCEHCASLNETLRSLRDSVPPGSYSVDARQFPLDGRCNPMLQGARGDDVRCVAAKLRICAEPTGKEPELAAALFEKQEGLTRQKALDIAGRILPPEALGPCLDAPATKAVLEQDIAAASRFDSDGTPIVAINGRKGTSFAPFLYAMVLTRGNPDHPAFAALPPGDPSAHLH